jgi:hypothetical protein
MTAGYSGKSLSDKLGIRAGDRVILLHGPDGIETTLGSLPAGAVLGTRRSRAARVTLLFATREADLRLEFPPLAAALPEGAMLWVAWPKKTSGRATDLSENLIREICLPTGWVDVKVCAIDETWSGLKFLRRRA